MKIKNETEIQLMKILFKTSKKKATKNITSRRSYPYGIESKYYRELKSFYKPLTDYVSSYISSHIEPLLRGDSDELHLDAIPGDSFRDMIINIEDWLSAYMPDISELPADSNNNVILTSLGKTADEAMEFGNKEFSKALEKGIYVNMPTTAPWWNDMKKSWAEDNYTLITSNAKNYVSKINTLTEQAIINGYSHSKLKDEIKKATESLSDKHCKLLARDQMGKLNGQINQAQMQEIGLDLYVWSTSSDDRVRDSHAVMEGILCRWDDADVCSYDNGKTWVERPSNAVRQHPGQDIQCRCVPLTFYPELVSEIESVPMDELTEDIPPIQEIENDEDPIKIAESFYSDGVATKNEDFKSYVMGVFENTEPAYAKAMSKIVGENKRSINYIGNRNKSSYFSPSANKVVLTHINDESVLRHEMGHFLDNVMGKDVKVHFKMSGEVYPRGKKHLSFSLTSDFSETYIRESKAMVNDLIKEAKNKGTIIDNYISLNEYLSSKYSGMNDREKLTICDMFTATKKKSFGGHPVSYFRNKKRESLILEFKNENILAEGFAELCEYSFSLDTSKDFKTFINDYFSESTPIINRMVDDYLKK